MHRTFEIDWDDPKNIKEHISKFQMRRKTLLRRLGYNEVKFNNSKYNLDTVLPVLNLMYDSDFTHLYESVSSYKDFYVYAHCNPLKKLDISHNIKHFFLASRFPNLTHEPFYIGKGRGDRYLQLNRNDSHKKVRQQLLKLKQDILSVKLVENVSEPEAFNKESNLIDILGLVAYKGILVNLDEGQRSYERRKLYQDDSGLVKRLLGANGYKG